jgi:porphobilinogen deaminase
MQSIRIIVPNSSLWLTELAKKKASSLAENVTTQSSDHPLRFIAHDEADICLMPLHQTPFQLPPGVVISALSSRIFPEFALLVRKDLADSARLLSVPESATVSVPDQIIARCIESYFPNIIIQVNSQLENAPELAVVSKMEAHLRNWTDEDYYIHELHPDEFTPAAGQGTIAWICREDHTEMRRTLKKIHCSDTVRLCNTERRIARKWQEKGINGNVYCSVHPAGHYQLNLCRLNSDDEIQKERYSSTVLSSWEKPD